MVDKYFDCSVNLEPLHARVAKAICGNCVVREECLSEALVMPHLQERGVIGGVNVSEVRVARQWRAYEQGITDGVPAKERPGWLPMTDATSDVEQFRIVDDPDEPTALDSAPAQAGAVLAAHPSQPETARRMAGLEADKARRKRRPRPARARFNVDVPVPLKGANCDVMPRELVDTYFNADVLRQAAAAQVAMLVCEHCAVLELCFTRSLNGSNVRESGVIAGMGARELERGRHWRRYEQGTSRTTPKSARPDWLPRTAAGERFDSPVLAEPFAPPTVNEEAQL